MQTPKSRPASLNVPRKQHPSSPHAARMLKTSGSDLGSAKSPNPVNRTPQNCPKFVGHRSPQSPSTEKKKTRVVSDLEYQVSHLKEELKKAKDQLQSPESLQHRFEQDAKEAKKELAAMSAELHTTKRQLKELSEFEEAYMQDLRKIYQDRDRAWQSELEAVRMNQSIDSSALASSVKEIQRLKIQLEMISESEALNARNAEAAHAEMKILRIEHLENVALVEKLKIQLSSSRESEAHSMEELVKAQIQLEIVKIAEEWLLSEHAIAMEHEVNRLRAALETAERRYCHECVKNTAEARNAYELLENIKSESSQREVELEADIAEIQTETVSLRAKLLEKEHAVKTTSSENQEMSVQLEENLATERESELAVNLKMSGSVFQDLKNRLLEKQTRLEAIREENRALKSEILKKEIERNKATIEALALAQAARGAEQEALMKMGCLAEEAENNCRKAAQVTKLLDSVQTANFEMESEVRRLKVQTEQWKKAAETALAILSTGNCGKGVERTGSLGYRSACGSPYSGDLSDSSPKKKNGNMIKKIGVLLKKGQK